MSMDDDIAILSRVRLFQGFGKEELRLLAFGTERLPLAAGRVIYREGQEADSGYVVVDGTVLLFHEADGVRRPLQRIGPGSLLGEMGLIARMARPSGAMAETGVELIRLNRSLFQKVLKEYPQNAALLYDSIRTDLQDLLERIEALGPRFSD